MGLGCNGGGECIHELKCSGNKFNGILSVFVDESDTPIFLRICNISVDLCIRKFVKGARVACQSGSGRMKSVEES